MNRVEARSEEVARPRAEQEQTGVEVRSKCLFSSVGRACASSAYGHGLDPRRGLCIDSYAILCVVRDETPALDDIGHYLSKHT